MAEDLREERLREYLDGYEFRGDDGDFSPNEWTRVLIEDALRGWMSEEDLIAPTPAGQAGGVQEAVAWRCSACNAPRAVSPCHKCGGALSEACEGWEEPHLPSIDRIRVLAREVGYGIGVHGSLERDLDLIAAPWIAEPVSPRTLAEHICHGLDARIVATFDEGPHGRVGFNIQQDGWFKLIDLSVMSPQAPATRVTEGMVEEAISEIDARFPGAFWTLGYGVTRDGEPPFGVRILFGSDEVLAEGEGATPVEAIRDALREER